MLPGCISTPDGPKIDPVAFRTADTALTQAVELGLQEWQADINAEEDPEDKAERQKEYNDVSRKIRTAMALLRILITPFLGPEPAPQPEQPASPASVSVEAILNGS